ncbi:MAG: glucose-1-phosphate thymidylyltransferase, partial [Firmicutes bacterium]|nr:glucose-1-phosphate thymidylyltransferase [Bacillota bacterium]
SGGTGSRLRPLTYTGAKQLIPVANQPILYYAIEAIREAGITQIGMIVGDTQAEIERACGDGSAFGVEITYIPQAAPLGLAHAVKIAEPFIGDDDFLMFLGDNLVRDGVRAFAEQFAQDAPNSLILLSRVPDPQRFGVAQIEDGQITRLIEKPKVPPSDLALVGVYLFDRSIFKAVHEIAPSARGELEITDAIQYLIDHGYRVEAHIIDGWWKDTGKPEDMLEANRMMVEMIAPRVLGQVDSASQIFGRAVIEAGAVIENSTIRGPVVIAKGAHIKDSYIGPFTSISEGVRIIGSELENSIILQDTVIDCIPTRIDSSLIGKNVHISQAQARPKALTFVLGDNSRAEVL